LSTRALSLSSPYRQLRPPFLNLSHLVGKKTQPPFLTQTLSFLTLHNFYLFFLIVLHKIRFSMSPSLASETPRYNDCSQASASEDEDDSPDPLNGSAAHHGLDFSIRGAQQPAPLFLLNFFVFVFLGSIEMFQELIKQAR
jgi:hypothetical protein